MAAEGNAELASIQTKHLGDSSLMILGLQQSLQSMKEMDMQDIVAVIGQMQGQMVKACPMQFDIADILGVSEPQTTS